jgi:chemotaxis response regulator CheB
MAKTKTAKLGRDIGPYMRRLLEDEQVHDQLSDAAARLRKAYQRAERKKKGAKAAEDKKLYAHVRGAATSLRGAALALQRKPPPKPKSRGRKIVVVGALAGGAALLAKRSSGSNGSSEYTERPAEPAHAG